MTGDNFGRSSRWSVGVEEEVMILDAQTHALAPAVEELVEATGELHLAGTVKTELLASVAELTTDVCADVEEAVEQLAALRAAVTAAASERGLTIAAAGTHPFSTPERQAVVQEERYLRMLDYAGSTARRQGVSGLHVHVGMPDAETCYGTLEAVLPWLPLVLALSANSPYLSGDESGLMSARAEILALLPRSGAPPAFGSYAGWRAFVERLASAGLPPSPGYTSFWWDVRPHPHYGTLEIRIADQPTALERTQSVVDLLRRLCRWGAESAPRPAVDPARRGDYQQNRWAAARFGPRAELIHQDGDRLAPVPELAAELTELIGPLTGLDPKRCEGDRQLEVGRTQGLEAVCADLVARSVA